MKFSIDEIRNCEVAYEEFRDYVRDFVEENKISKYRMINAWGICEEAADSILTGNDFRKMQPKTIARIIAYMRQVGATKEKSHLEDGIL